jgi:PAS domain S-box-containing protein
MSRLEGTALDHALARAGDGVFVIGDEGRIILWNRAAERILGYGAKEILGRPCCEVFVGRDDKGNRLCYQGCHVMTLVRLGEPVQNFDMKTQNRAGQPLWLNISILTVPNGRPNGSLLVPCSATSRRRELLTLVHEHCPRGTAAPGVRRYGVLTRREIGSSGSAPARPRRRWPSASRQPGHGQEPAEHSELGVHSRPRPSPCAPAPVN